MKPIEPIDAKYATQAPQIGQCPNTRQEHRSSLPLRALRPAASMALLAALGACSSKPKPIAVENNCPPGQVKNDSGCISDGSNPNGGSPASKYTPPSGGGAFGGGADGGDDDAASGGNDPTAGADGTDKPAAAGAAPGASPEATGAPAIVGGSMVNSQVTTQTVDLTFPPAAPANAAAGAPQIKVGLHIQNQRLTAYAVLSHHDQVGPIAYAYLAEPQAVVGTKQGDGAFQGAMRLAVQISFAFNGKQCLVKTPASFTAETFTPQCT